MSWQGLWQGKMTEELKDLHTQYRKMFNGFDACGYEEISYEGLTYEEYVGYIKESLKQGKELPNIMYPDIDDNDEEYS